MSLETIWIVNTNVGSTFEDVQAFASEYDARSYYEEQKEQDGMCTLNQLTVNQPSEVKNEKRSRKQRVTKR